MDEVGFSASSVVYIVYAIFHFIKGGEPFPLAGYIPVDAFIFGEVPAVLLFMRTFLLGFIKRNHWQFSEKIFLLFLASTITFTIVLLTILLGDGRHL